ncbi:GNAT family N-acetyltransferase [Actinotalea sp. BY-33]|uniref:GNAT family N-acetyltransferase n=1 Tax=Actinotalea soli TaxID=2819234 RepID=A0A939LQF1_9CELL|nr:GNAT family N-acetyltransferase [Actinotalea soli]MBO1752521.1 GNAT family N-acetyltransferase [Actinotalea soli]
MIDAFRTEDLDEAAAVFRAVFNKEPWNDAWDLRSARSRLADVLATPGSLGVCLRLDGRLRGFALGHVEQWFTGRHFFLNEMCVETGEQGRGYGSGLLSALERRLVGIEQIYLLTSREGAAEKFYLRGGFRTASRQQMLVKALPGTPVAE